MRLIRDARLRALGISDPRFRKPDDALRWLVASQAQDFHTAKWAVGLRAKGTTVADVDALYDKGRILRTHVMRPTWHFVLDEDIRWLVELTAPRVRSSNAAMTRKLGLDARLLTRTNDLITRALEGGTHLTREQLREVLERAGVDVGDGQRLAYIVFAAEVEALICSGKMRGKQTTYALLSERAPKARKLDKAEALHELATRYAASRGPVTPHDFAKWSGLTVADAKKGLGDISSSKATGTTKVRAGTAPVAHLLSIYDEYISSYKDRSAMLAQAGDSRKLVGLGNALQFLFIIDGVIQGTWRRELDAKAVDITLKPFRKLTPAQRRAVALAADRYAAFYGLEVAQLSWTP